MGTRLGFLGHPEPSRVGVVSQLVDAWPREAGRYAGCCKVTVPRACSFLLPPGPSVLCFLPFHWAVVAMALSSRFLRAGAALGPFHLAQSVTVVHPSWEEHGRWTQLRAVLLSGCEWGDPRHRLGC